MVHPTNGIHDEALIPATIDEIVEKAIAAVPAPIKRFTFKLILFASFFILSFSSSIIAFLFSFLS